MSSTLHSHGKGLGPPTIFSHCLGATKETLIQQQYMNEFIYEKSRNQLKGFCTSDKPETSYIEAGKKFL